MKPKHIAVLVAWASAAAAVSAQSPMREGRWEITSQMEMANMPIKMPEMKAIRCVTPEQSKDPSKALPSPSNPNDKNQACKVSDYKAVGNAVSWKIACTGAQSMTGSGEMVFEGDSSYTGTMKMTMQQGEMSVKYSAKRLGDCMP